MIGDRVRFPAGDAVGEGVVCGYLSVDGSAHAAVRLDDGRYRTVPLIRMQRVVPDEPAEAAA